MHKILPILLAATLLNACASSGGVAGGPLDLGSEVYRGPKTAAVTPVSDRRPGPSDAQLRAEIQRSIQRRLDHSGIFAGVVALDRADEGNEAEVIIEPLLVGSTGYGRDDVELRFRVTEKTKRRVVLDEHNRGDGHAKELKVAIRELEEDLGNRYTR
ncbi:MAG: hypothetical protein LJE70_17615 [Chromatiaceae bacterium]|jgi:hypothetical protein|nr:hypothetical protein [Chromatiaceae bacterium]